MQNNHSSTEKKTRSISSATNRAISNHQNELSAIAQTDKNGENNSKIKKTQRVHTINDLVLSLLILLSIGQTVFLCILARQTMIGFASDFHSLAKPIALYVQFPLLVLYSIGLYLFPIFLAIHMLLKRQFRAIFLSVTVALISYIFTTLAQNLIVLFASDSLSPVLFLSTFNSLNLRLPVIISCICAALCLIGPKTRDSAIIRTWWALAVYSILLVIFALSTLAGTLLCLQIGGFVGLFARFLIGRESGRAVGKQLQKAIKRAGFEIDGSLKPIATTSLNKRIFLANSGVSQLRIVVFDADKQALGWINQILQFLRNKEANFRSQSFSAFVQHVSLANWAVYSAGANNSKLLGVTVSGESAIFIFEDDLPVATLSENNCQKIDPSHYWNELKAVHKVSFSWHSISPNQLKIRGDRAAIWECERGEIASTSIQRRIDETQLLVSLSFVYGVEKSVKSYLDFVNSESKKQENLLDEIAAVLSLSESFTMPFALRRTKGLKEQLLKIRIALQNYLDSNLTAQTERNTIQIKRFQVKTIVTTGLTVTGILLALTQLNYDLVVSAFTNSNHLVALFAVLFSLLTFLGAAVVLQACSRGKIEMKPAFLVQIAASKELIRLPAGTGAFVTNREFLDHYIAKNNPNTPAKHRGAQSLATASIVQIFQIVGTLAATFVFAFAGGMSLIKPGSDQNLNNLLQIVAVCVVIILIVPKSRKFIFKLMRNYIVQFSSELAFVITQPRRVILAFIGVFTQTLGYILCLWMCAFAFSLNFDFLTIGLILLLASSAASASPTPGGIGAQELALSTMLISAGTAPSVAVSVTLLFRIVTFWIRIPLGNFVHSALKNSKVL